MIDLNDPFLIAFAGAFLAGGMLLLFVAALTGGGGRRIGAIEEALTRQEKELRDEIDRFRHDLAAALKDGRLEQRDGLKGFEDSLLGRMAEFSLMQKNQFEASAGQIKTLATAMESELGRMRVAVDEKLADALDKRISGSFAQVTAQLEKVHQGLGEMQTLATGVGDLQKTLANVKSRGTWGEVQLGALLAETLSTAQYEKNIAPHPGSNDRVEYAVKLPGGDASQPVWLPIDAKFPLANYQALQEAQEKGSRDEVEKAGRDLERQIKMEAKKIRDKYVSPPYTTDFALLFLPSEGLYAEALRRPGLQESLQNELRVTLAGPVTLTALLNALNLGFRSLAISERAGEVWELLGAVRNEFGKFGEALEKTRRKLQEASGTIDQVEVRTRAIERTLRQTEELTPPGDETNGAPPPL